jgi:hypothetical protein
VNQPPPEEWDFSEFYKGNALAQHCYEWEYYREVYKHFPAFKKAVEEFQKDPNSENPALQLQGKGIARLWFVENESWPSLSFKDSRVKEPGESIGEGIGDGFGLQKCLRDVCLHRLPALGCGEELENACGLRHWPAGTVLAKDSYLVAAIAVDFRIQSQKDIIESFERWLQWARSQMEFPPKKSQGNAAGLKQAQSWLKKLTALRLLEGRRYKEAVHIWNSRNAAFEKTELFVDQSGWTEVDPGIWARS